MPQWYPNIKWLDPVLPPDWEKKIDGLLEYRKNSLITKYSKH